MDKDFLTSRPWVDGVGFADGVDFLRGVWDEDIRAMIITLKSWSTAIRNITLNLRNLPNGHWAVYIDGRLKGTRTIEDGDDLEVKETVGADEVDVIVASI